MRNPVQLRRERVSRSLFCAALTVLLVLGTAPAWAQEQLEPSDDFNKGGRTSFQFLKIGVGARQAALGEASIAMVRDVNATFWNPANIAGIENVEASFNYNRWLADMNYTAGAVGYRWDGVGILAFNVASLDYGDIPESLVTGSGTSKDTRTGNTFSGGDLLLGLTYAREFTDRLAIGVAVKYVREDLWNHTASNVAFDVGTNYRMGYKGITLAMSAQNFAGGVSFLGEDESDRTEGYDMPLLFRIGVSSNVVGDEDGIVSLGAAHRLVMSVEAINTNDYSERFHLGGEYTFADLLSLRGGYRFNYQEGNLALGFGLSPEVSGIQARIDYAYVAYKYLDAPHRLSLTLAF